MTKDFPKIDDELMEKLCNGRASRVLPPDASPLEKQKYGCCREVLRYKMNRQLNAKFLAELLNIEADDLDRILHYHTENFTLDQLQGWVNQLNR